MNESPALYALRRHYGLTRGRMQALIKLNDMGAMEVLPSYSVYADTVGGVYRRNLTPTYAEVLEDLGYAMILELPIGSPQGGVRRHARITHLGSQVAEELEKAMSSKK